LGSPPSEMRHARRACRGTKAEWGYRGFAPISLFFMYFMFYFIIIYFNTAIIGFATMRLERGYPEIRDGIRVANRNLWPIFKWAVVAATVGTILKIIHDRGVIGKIVAVIAGFAWSMATFFITPVFVYEKMSIRDSLKRSISLFEDTWGEMVVGNLSLGAILFSLGLAGISLVIFGALLGSTGFIIGFSLALIYWIILSCIGIAAQGVLTAALYRYAISGYPPDFIPPVLLKP